MAKVRRRGVAATLSSRQTASQAASACGHPPPAAYNAAQWRALKPALSGARILLPEFRPWWQPTSNYIDESGHKFCGSGARRIAARKGAGLARTPRKARAKAWFRRPRPRSIAARGPRVTLDRVPVFGTIATMIRSFGDKAI